MLRILANGKTEIMDSIPAEVLGIVFNEIAHPEVDSWVLETLGEPNADLKALRLTCKRFATMASPLLYERLLVFMNATSFSRMTAIASHPDYRQMVKQIWVFPRHFAVKCPFFGKGEYQLHAEYALRRFRAWDPAKQPVRMHEVLDPLGPPLLSNERIDAGYKQYTQLRLEQSVLLPQVPQMLQDAFDKFSRLAFVAAGRFGESQNVCYPTARPVLSSYLRHFYEKCLLVLTGDRNPCCGLDEMEVADEMIVVIRALALSKASSTVKELEIWNIERFPDLSLVNLTDDDFGSIKTMFARLKALKFPLPEWATLSPEEHLENRMIREEARDKWLDCLHSSLETGYLIMSDSPISRYSGGAGFDRLSTTLYFPRLFRLDLLDIKQGISRVELSTFIKRHASTLRSLIICRVWLSSGSWYGVFEDIRNGNLDILVLAIRYSKSTKKFFAGQENCVENAKLNKFIQGSGHWPADLPAGLLKDAHDADLV